MITVHHLNNSRSQRILWLLEELGVPYEIKRYQRTSEQRAPPELLKVSPLGKSPVLIDTGVDGKENITLAESGAIVEYLLKVYSNGKFASVPSGQEYIDNLYFTHYAEGSIMPTMVLQFIFTLIPQRSPWLLRPLLSGVFSKVVDVVVKPELKKHSDLVESHLSRKAFFAGGSEPTSADFMMIMPAEILEYLDVAGPKTKEYVKRIHERPAYKTALEKGGEYSYAKL
ncbi:thioredoxin-like protein [Marasmius fiardii PR-910]|nr:thioredoxin-like protein [Marasmius fiardii PR-910]